MKIVIFQPMLKFYRVPLFEKLHQLLVDSGHELRLVFGTPWDEELKRNDNVVVYNDYCFFEKSHWLFNNKLHFLEGSIKHILWADVIITEQANKHVHNYLLILLYLLKIKALGYWGHGLNRQGNPKSPQEVIKRLLAVKVDWWFAYTQGVADYLRDLGFPYERITVLNNSVDTIAFKKELEKITDQELVIFKQQHGIPENANVGIFCGSFHQDKKIEFLLESAVLIHQKDPRFMLLIGGAGRDVPIVEHYVTRHNFIVYLGSLHDRQKALAFKSADVFLNPGMVGLAILDAFTASLPVFTTKQAEHSPEIDYLQCGYNGMMAEMSVGDFAGMVLSAFASETLIPEMQNNALASSEQFSIENMANHFLTGIQVFGNQPHR